MSHRCLQGVVLAAWALSCSGGDGRGGTPDAGGHTAARLAIVITAPRDVAAGDVASAAHLVRYRDVDAEGAQLLAGGSASPADFPALGRCALVDAEARVDDTLASLSPEASIEMLDAGDLVFRVAGRALTLSPRYVPELLPFVTGTAYEGSAGGTTAPLFEPPLELDLPGEAWASAAGGDDVGRFEAQAPVPAVPWIAASRSGGAVLVTWAPAERIAGADEAVSIVVQADGAQLRCRAADAGRFAIGPGVLALLPDAAGAMLAVERSARAPFAAAGLDAGELTVTVRDVVPLPAD